MADSPPLPAWPEIDRAFIELQTATLSFQLGRPGAIWVSPDGGEVLFTRSGPRSTTCDLFAFSLATGQERRLVAADALLGGAPESLSDEEEALRERLRQSTRGITAFTASDDGTRLAMPVSGRLFMFERPSDRLHEIAGAAGAFDPQLSPDGTRVAFARDGDLHVVEVAGGARRLTHRTSPDVSHGVAEFVAAEEMDRMHGFWWSPDGATLAVQRTDAGPVETLYLHDGVHPERPAASARYPRAGTANAVVELALVPAAGGEPTWVAWDRAAFPYLATVTWPRGGPLTIVVQDRAQQEELVLAVDRETGATRELLRERDDAWLNLDQTVPRWLDDGSGFLWSTERGGAWQLELHAVDGQLLRTLTPPELGYLGVAGLDGSRRAVWVRATGGDARTSHVFRVPLDGGEPERVTHGDALHQIAVGERSGAHVVAATDRTGETRWHVRRGDGAEVGLLRSEAERPPFVPNVELATVTVDGRAHHAVVVRPSDHRPGRRYSVLIDVYGGPHVGVVVADPRAYALDQWYADAGFVVVRIDGRGTPNRGRAWERAIRGDLVGVALADQIAVLGALAADRPEMDLDQVGIFGWSFGGTMAASAALLYPEIFRAAVAGAPVTDWRDYDTHYTERYLGLPAENPAGYASSSPLTHAARLERPLFLAHGTTDDNVYFSHTMKMSQALLRAGRAFDMLPLAGFTHMVQDPAIKTALASRIIAFFRQHLAAPR